jgi:hypothetical protein
MNILQIEQALNEWAEYIAATDKAIDDFVAMCGGDLDSKFLRPFCEMQSAYTAAVGKLVGDDESWLQYYWMDCDMGRTPRKVNCGTLKTIRQLAALIYNEE